MSMHFGLGNRGINFTPARNLVRAALNAMVLCMVLWMLLCNTEKMDGNAMT